MPFSNQIENPDPVPGTNNYYTQDGYGGGSYVNCADPSQPGVEAVNHQLRQQGVHRNNCEPGHYYLLNNYNLFWNQTSGSRRTLGADKFTLRRQRIPTIADGMTRRGLTEMTTEERTPEQVATEREQDVCGRCESFAGLPR